MKLSMKKILPIVLTASLVAACGGATAKQQTAPEKSGSQTGSNGPGSHRRIQIHSHG